MLRKTFIIWLIFTNISLAQQHLILIGGGKRPADVLTKFIELSGKEQSHILIIPWASSEQAESFASIKGDITALSAIKIENSPSSPLTAETKAQFLQQLKAATGVFFTGGDQNSIMKVLQDEELFNALHDKYEHTTVFAGTSAGTAIMTPKMISGEGDFKVIDGSKVDIQKGLGLLPKVIVDQHFIKRQRQNRLLGLIWLYPDLLGMGIDENTAVWVEGNRWAEVLGESQVMIFDAQKKSDEMKVFLLKKGEKFDLKKRKRIGK